MKSVRELELLSAELEKADREILASVVRGNYRPARVEGLAGELFRFVLNDLTGHQEKVDLSFWDGFDPQEYLEAFAGEEDGYRALVEEVFEEATEAGHAGPIKEKLWKNPLHKKVRELTERIERSFLFCYYTLASRRPEEIIERRKQEAKEVWGILNGVEENRLLDFMGLVPNAFSMKVLDFFSPEGPYPEERKLLLEIPYGEFLANLHRGEPVEDHLLFMGITSDREAKQAYRQLKDFSDRLARGCLDWKRYSFDDYGLAVYFSQSAKYSKAGHDLALMHIKKLRPQTPVENLLLGRAWENLGRNTHNPEYLRIASEYYEKAGNFLKALECQLTGS